jgi:hypothetical protein
MIRTLRHRLSVVAALAALSIAVPASAQNGPPPGSKGAEKKDEKAGDKGEKGKDKAEGAKDAKDAKGADAKGPDANSDGKGKGADVAARKKAQKEAVRAKVQKALDGQPMAAAMKQELTRHARREARLQHIITVAKEAKDTATVERATKLLEKENARHDKWVAGFDAKTGTSKGGAE